MTKPMTGAALKLAIRRLGFTQQDFADYIGVDVRTVRRQQSGESPVPQTTAMVVLSLLRDLEKGKARP